MPTCLAGLWWKYPLHNNAIFGIDAAFGSEAIYGNTVYGQTSGNGQSSGVGIQLEGNNPVQQKT